MNSLEKFHITIDESGWDAAYNDLNKSFQEINEEIIKTGDEELLRKSEVERWTFSFNKNPETGITCMTAGTKTLENEDEVPFEWPDKNELTDDDFAHLFERFNECKNIYAKTEYGLLLYYCNRLIKNGDVKNLLSSLLELAKVYYENSLPKDNKNHYIIYFKIVMGNAFKIAHSRKNSPDINHVLKELIEFNTHVHNTWDVCHHSTLRSIIDLTNFAIKYKKEFEKIVALEKYLDQNYLAANELAKTYSWGCIYVCDISQKLADYLKIDKYNWQLLKAQQFENMIQGAVDTGNLAAVSFAEDALSIYKKLGDSDKISELEKRYDELRRIFRLGQIKQELPKEHVEHINQIIKDEIENKTGEELMVTLTLSPMFAPVEDIEKMAEQLGQENFISNLFPSSIIDKFGNTIEVFATEEENKQYNFWQTYDHNFQIGSQSLATFFIEGIKSGKINYDIVEIFINKTWIGQKYNVMYNGYENTICPYDVIQPALVDYFSELTKWNDDNSYIPNFICATDSLVTKTEYLIRFFCKLAGIATFTDKQKGPHKYKMEKNIDELLNSLKHTEENPTGFNEGHRKFIQFILTQKVGHNLRHRIAHGLMDADEYSFINPLYILIIILKISGYNFN